METVPSSGWNGSVIAGLKKKNQEIRLGDYNQCCHLGIVSLPELGQSPVELFELLAGDNARSVELRRNIRQINSLFAMASLKSTSPADRNVGQGHWCFCISGQITQNQCLFKTEGRTSTTNCTSLIHKML